MAHIKRYLNKYGFESWIDLAKSQLDLPTTDCDLARLKES
jgi:hypothetical protein